LKKNLLALANEVKELNGKVTSAFEKLDAEGVDGESRQPTADEATQIKDWNKQIEAKEQEIAGLREYQDIREAADARSEEMRKAVSPHLHSGKVIDDRQEQIRNFADAVLENKDFKAWHERYFSGGRMPSLESIKESPPVDIPFSYKSLVTGASATSAGALITNDRKPIVDPGVFYRPLTLKDIITMGTTESDTVEYAREGTHTNAAAVVAEASATGDGSGASPESSFVLSEVTESVKTISHWIPATLRALADAGQMRTLLDAFLEYGVNEELEDQILVGSGVGQNFTGVANTANIGSQAFSNDILETLRKARTKVRTQGRAKPTAYVLHPNDWEAIDLLQDNDGRYFYGGPSVLGMPRIWGLPVVECEAQVEGQGHVADWRLAVLWDRQQTQISVSNSHQDFFVRRLVAILAEMRAAFGILRPAAFVEIDLAA
jgi:HK97 family phage major capsid protein